MKDTFKIALAGNPNCGKTTIFNMLTGARQHVGNYPGVTVERKSGYCRIGGMNIEVVDLPGTYSLSSSSIDETIAFREIVSADFDLILNVVDAGNLQRNLYLTTQLAELRIPMILVFNMMDEAKSKGMCFNRLKLEHFFGTKIVETIGSRGRGVEELKTLIFKVLKGELEFSPMQMNYGPECESALKILTEEIRKLNLPECRRIPERYFAIKLLENDGDIVGMKAFEPLLETAKQLREKLAERLGENSETLIADCRYGIIFGAYRETVRIVRDNRIQITEQIDKIVMNRFLGLPIFLFMMYLVFTFTFTCADPIMGWMESGFAYLSGAVDSAWPEGKMEFLRAVLSEGIIGGVGGVLVFLPNILLLFLAIAVLEASGYMSRAAFVMDGFMHLFGLHGKSFIPMLLGFGCTVPAVMATRTIESEKDRLTTIMILPMMSCSARLPIYTIIVAAFFQESIQPLMMFIIYVTGIVMALICARLLKSTLFSGENDTFVMELPPYRMPSIKSIVLTVLERGMLYLKKAGTIILFFSILLFLLNTFPVKKEFSRDYAAEIEAVENSSTISSEEKPKEILHLETERKAELLEYSIAGKIGHVLEVFFRPLGFDWRISSALIGALPAKELFVSQLGILYSIGDADEESDLLRTQLRENYTPLQGFAVMIFSLLSMPCIATVAIVRRETNSWKYTIFQCIALTAVAYLVTLIVYQTGLFLKIGTALLS